MSEREEIAVRCPVCNEGNLRVTSMLYNVPFFNEIVMFVMECPKCHFSHNDIFAVEQRPPARWTLHVKDPSLLRVRVVRSSSGTVRIPEFGIDVEPGPAAEGFISNVEGVLYRIRSVVQTAVNFAEGEQQRQRALEVLRMMDEAIEGEREFTLVLEDPAGVSGILPDDMRLVKYEELSVEEASRLRGAPFWLDLAREELRGQEARAEDAQEG